MIVSPPIHFAARDRDPATAGATFSFFRKSSSVYDPIETSSQSFFLKGTSATGNEDCGTRLSWKLRKTKEYTRGKRKFQRIYWLYFDLWFYNFHFEKLLKRKGTWKMLAHFSLCYDGNVTIIPLVTNRIVIAGTFHTSGYELYAVYVCTLCLGIHVDT